jgi:hypothetical protein
MRGELYVDDGETFEFAGGGFVHRRFVFDGKELSSVSLGGRFWEKYDVVISQIEITGLAATAKKIVREDGSEVKFAVRDGVTTVLRLNALVKEDFSLLTADASLSIF